MLQADLHVQRVSECLRGLHLPETPTSEPISPASVLNVFYRPPPCFGSSLKTPKKNPKAKETSTARKRSVKPRIRSRLLVHVHVVHVRRHPEVVLRPLPSRRRMNDLPVSRHAHAHRHGEVISSARHLYITIPGASPNSSSSRGICVCRRYWSKIGVRFMPVCWLKYATTSSVMMF